MRKLFPVLLIPTAACLLCSLVSAKTLAENLQQDSDGDHLSDAIEIVLGLNPQNPQDGLSDDDGDGFTLAEEIEAGTDSNNFNMGGRATSTTSRVLTTSPRPAPRKLAKTIKAANNLIKNSGWASTIKPKVVNTANFGGQTAQWSEVNTLDSWQPNRGTTLQVWQVNENTFLRIGDGVKQPLQGLTSNHYILKWKQRRPADNLKIKDYQVKISNSTGKIVLLKNFQPRQAEQWEEVTVEFRINLAETGTNLSLSFSPNDNLPSPVFIDDICLLSAGMDVDLNRDGKISQGEGPLYEIPFYFWINNDSDNDEVGGEDLSTSLLTKTDFNDNKVNSIRDLMDFFPVNLNLAQAIKAFPPDGQTRYRLSQKDGAVNIVFTGLAMKNAGSYNQGAIESVLGDSINQSWAQAEVHRLNPDIELTEAQITRLLAQNGSIILVEGRRTTTEPLLFTIERAGVKCLEISLPLRLNDVETMYRHLNLRDAVTTYEGKSIPDRLQDYGRPTEMDNPTGLPDNKTNAKTLVFVHGFNVNAQEARGWNNEMFKRFYLAGSQARFIGVTWRGDTSPDYHEAVFRAFQTGEALAKSLKSNFNTSLTLAGHSLGNMVVGNAIQRGNLTPQACLAINAAVPAEAYSSEAATSYQRQTMTELGWRKYETRLYASYWNEIFPAIDARSKLTWRNQFSKAKAVTHNFYSWGDDIISKANNVSDASIIKLILNQGFNFSSNAWKYQELIKGVSWYDSIARVFLGRNQAGWAFNDDWWLWTSADEGDKMMYSPTESRRIANSRLITKPFFDNFIERELQSNQKNTGSIKATQTRVIYDLLARGIPAMTYATGAESLTDNIKYNYDLEFYGRHTSQWPIAGHEKPSQKLRWLHSDIKNVALPIIYPTFQTMVSQGLLK